MVATSDTCGLCCMPRQARDVSRMVLNTSWTICVPYLQEEMKDQHTGAQRDGTTKSYTFRYWALDVANIDGCELENRTCSKWEEREDSDRQVDEG